MRRGALLYLLVRPLTIVLAAMCVPLVVILLFKVGSLRPVAAIGISSFVCVMVGFHIGEGIREAVRCTFAWTLPGNRRALLSEFVICGVAVSALAALVGALFTTAPHPTAVAVVVGFAAFSLGAVLLVPECSLVFPVAFVAVFAWLTPRRSPAATMLDAPLATVTVALVVSALALWYGFSSRTFRWSALTGPYQDGRFIWHEWPTIPWWPKRRIRRTRPEPRSPSRVRYLGTSVLRGVVSSFRATKPGAWLVALTLWVFCLLFLVPNNMNTVRMRPLPWLWAVVVTVAWVVAWWSRRSAGRAALPWSRRQHLAVTYLRDVGGLAGFLMMVAPGLIAAGPAISPDVFGAVARGLGVVALFFPAVQWVSGPPTGGRWPDRGVAPVLGVLLVLLFLLVLDLVVHGLPNVVSSGVAQAVVLGLLLVGSQVLNWRWLKRYFADRDLVGGTM